MAYNSKELKVKSTAKKLAKPKDVDYKSKMGYRDDSPYRDNPFINIYSEDGTIDMSNTGIPLIANGIYLPEYSGQYYMGTNLIKEVPAYNLDPGFSVNSGRGTGIAWPTINSNNLTAGDYNRMRGLKPGLFAYGRSIPIAQNGIQSEISGDFITKLSPKEEIDFQNFYKTLPDNLKQDDNTYDLRGYWDSENRPSAFDYSQPVESDGYFHAYSRNQYTDKILKAPTHKTFRMAIEEDKKGGLAPLIGVDGNVYTKGEFIPPVEDETGAPLNTNMLIDSRAYGGYLADGRNIYQNGGQKESGTYVQVDTPEGVKTLNTDSDEYRKYYSNLYRQVGDVFEAPNMLPEATVTGVDPRSIDPMTGERFAMWDQLPAQYKQVIEGNNPMSINARNVARQGHVSPNTYLADVRDQIVNSAAEATPLPSMYRMATGQGDVWDALGTMGGLGVGLKTLRGLNPGKTRAIENLQKDKILKYISNNPWLEKGLTGYDDVTTSGYNAFKNLIKKNIKPVDVPTQLPGSPNVATGAFANLPRATAEQLENAKGFLPRRQFVKDMQAQGLIGKEFNLNDVNYAARFEDKTEALAKLALERRHTGFRTVKGEIPRNGIGYQNYTRDSYDMSRPAFGQNISEIDNMKKAGVDFNDPKSIAEYQATHIPLEDYGYRSTGQGSSSKYDFLFRSPGPETSNEYGNFQFKSKPNLDFTSGNYKDWFNKYSKNLTDQETEYIKYRESSHNIPDIQRRGLKVETVMPWKNTKKQGIGNVTLVGPRGTKAYEIDKEFPFTDMKNLTPKQRKDFEEYIKNYRKQYSTGWRGEYQPGGIVAGSPEYADAYRKGTIVTKGYDGVFQGKDLPEATVTSTATDAVLTPEELAYVLKTSPSVDRNSFRPAYGEEDIDPGIGYGTPQWQRSGSQRYPNWDGLTKEEKRLITDSGPIGRNIRSKAGFGKDYYKVNEDESFLGAASDLGRFIYETSPLSAIQRRVSDPMGTLEGLYQTSADILGSGIAIGDYYLGSGQGFSGVNPLTGKNYGEGLDEVLDIADIIPAGAIFKKGYDAKNLVKSIATADNTIREEGKKFVNRLLTPEGLKRLKNQFAKADPTLNNEQLDWLVQTRINELNTATKYNKARALASISEGDPKILENKSMVEQFMPNQNAHFNRTQIFDIQNVKAPSDLFPINSNVTNLNDIDEISLARNQYGDFLNPDFEPGIIALGRGLETNKGIVRHEGAHAIQKGKMPIDYDLLEMMKSKNLADRAWRAALTLTPQLKYNDLNYFEKAGGRSLKNEAYPFEEELRSRLLNRGIIKDDYQTITPWTLARARLDALTQLSSTGKNFKEGTRLLKFTPPWKYKELARLMNEAPGLIPTIIGAGVLGAEALQEEKYGGGFKDLNFNEEDYMKKGGSKKLKINSKFTNKNIQSSINELFKRNETLFGPKGKKYYKPFEEGGSTNNTNMKKLTDKEIAFPQQPTAAEFYARGFVPNAPVGFYRQGGMSPAEAYPQQPPADIFFSGYPFQPQYMRGGMTNGIAFPQQPTAEYFFSGFPWESKYETGGSSSSAPQDMNSIDAQIGNKKNNLLKFLQSNATKAIAREEAQKVKQQMMPRIKNYFNEGGYFDQAKPEYMKNPYTQKKINAYQTMADDSMAGLKSGIPQLGLDIAKSLGNVFDKPQEEIVSDQYMGTGPNVSTETPYEGTEVEVNPSAGNFDWNSPGGFGINKFGGYNKYAPGGEWTWADEWEQKDKAAKLKSAIREKQGAQWQALPADMSYEDLVALAAKEGIIKMSDINQGTQNGNLYPIPRRGRGFTGYGDYRYKIKGRSSAPIFSNMNQGTGYPNMSNFTPEQQAAMKKEYADMGYDLEYLEKKGLLRDALGLDARVKKLKITKRPGTGSGSGNENKSDSNKDTKSVDVGPPYRVNPNAQNTYNDFANIGSEPVDRNAYFQDRINQDIQRMESNPYFPEARPESMIPYAEQLPEEKYGELYPVQNTVSPVQNVVSPTTQGQVAPLDFYVNPSLEQAAEENAVMPNQKYGGGFNSQGLRRFFPGGVNRADKMVVTQRGPGIFNPYATEGIMQGITGVLNNAQQRKASQAILAGLQGADATFVKDQPYQMGTWDINAGNYNPYAMGAKTTGVQSNMDANINPGITQGKYGGQGGDDIYYLSEEDIEQFKAMGGELIIFDEL